MEFLLLFALVTSLAIVQGEECMPLEDNPCVFKCNGTTFDLSNLFDYPFNITGPYDADLYVWNPCTGMKCPPGSKTDSNAAVCQGGYVDCGQNDRPVFLLQQQNPYMFKIEYPNGMTWRLSSFQFIEDKKHPKTKVALVNEQPMLQYNFVVTGKCVGQPDCH